MPRDPGCGPGPVRQAFTALAVIAAVVVGVELGRRFVDRFGDALEGAALREAAMWQTFYEHERDVRAALPRVEYEAWCALHGLEP